MPADPWVWVAYFWTPLGRFAAGTREERAIILNSLLTYRMIYGALAKNGRLSSHTQKKWGRHMFQKFYVKQNISNQKKQFSSSKLAFGLGLPSATTRHNQMIILRPFIQFSRFELLKFCEFWNWPILPDFTNLNTCFRRNHLRLQWIPYLKIFLNLNLFKKIDQFQQILHLENQYFQLFLQKIFWNPLYLNNHFFYFPKIFQYFILYHFYYFVHKKISFNEISCIFQKLHRRNK